MSANPTGSDGAMIRVRQVVKRYRGATILSGVSLEVRQGETAALIGGSGSGKSTLLRCINALETFDSGAVEVAGLTLSAGEARGHDDGPRRALRRRVGMVFQQFNLFPHMTALENVMSGPRFALGLSRETAEARAVRLLERVGLRERMAHKPTMLSGGQQQRVAIARALAMEPEAMLFDEPTSALDPRMTAEVLDVIGALAAEGLTMLIVSHAMGFVQRAAGRVHVLSHGEVVESGSAEQVFSDAQHAATRELLAKAREGN